MEALNNLTLYLTGIIDPLVIIVLVYAMWTSEYLQSRPRFHRIGVGMCAVGMFGQAYWSWRYIITDELPTYLEMPLWIGKDIGIWMVAMYFFINVICKPKQ